MDFIKKHWLLLVAALAAVWYYRRSSTSSIGVSGSNPYGVSSAVTSGFMTAVSNSVGGYGITANDVQLADQSVYPGYYIATSSTDPLAAPAYFNPDTGAYFSPGTSPLNYNLSTDQQAALDALGTGQGQALADTAQSAIDNYDPDAPKSQKIVF
jgi:hypothetical protein